MTDPTPEEKFNSDLWHVLQAIKKQVLYASDKHRIPYTIIQGFFGTPYNDDEEALMEKLHNWHIITLEKHDGVLSYRGDGEMVFIIQDIDPKFYQLYRLYENGLKKQISGQQLFQLVQELVNPTGRDHDLSFELWQLSKPDEDRTKERSLKSLMTRTLVNIQTVYDLSAENRAKVKRLIEVMQNQIELTGFKFSILGKDPLEIPIEILEREGFSVAEVELLIDKMDKTADHHFIKINTNINNKLLVSNDIHMPHSTDKVTKVLIEIESVPTLEDIKSHLESFERHLEQSSKDEEAVETVEEKASTTVTEKPPVIKYNSLTGIGQVNDNKEFKFKDHQPEYRVFKLLYDAMNKKVARYDVLLAAHFYEDGEDQDPARKTAETNEINDIAKTIRKKTGLNTEQLVNNNGNLTLIGTKAENPPEQPQN